MSGKLYFSTVMILMALFTGWYVSFSANMEPFSGTQTRIGGFLERDFGIQAPYEEFEQPLFAHGESLQDYSRYFDVIVVGDSFTSSENRRVSWLNYFSRDHGVTALFLHIDTTPIDELINHPVFRRQPPRVLIVESTEPMAFLRFKRISVGGSFKASIPPRSIQAADQPTSSDTTRVTGTRLTTRRTETDFNDRMRVGGNHILKSVERWVLGNRINKVIANPISCDSCFSNARKDEFLIERRSLDPLAYDLDFADIATSRVRELKAAVEGNGVTQLRTVIFPNKINVYANHVPNRGLVSVYDLDLPIDEIGLVPLLDRLRQSVENEVVDVYLPNDHHTSAIGYKVASRAISESLGWQY